MNYLLEEDIREENVLDIAKKMSMAARTAPKGKGVDNLFIAIFTKDKLNNISNNMIAYAEKNNAPGFFIRDAKNLLAADCMLVLGTKIQAMNVFPCGYCGFNDCSEKNQYKNIPCAFNTGDLGIAVGSAVDIASKFHVDNRIMFSVGKYLVESNILPSDIKIAYAILLSSSKKNPFFDRKKKKS